MKNAKRKKPKRTMPYIRAVLDRLTRRRWPDWKQEFADEQLLWERFLWCGGDIAEWPDRIAPPSNKT
jgi:hypothetical protein